MKGNRQGCNKKSQKTKVSLSRLRAHGGPQLVNHVSGPYPLMVVVASQPGTRHDVHPRLDASHEQVLFIHPGGVLM